MTKIGPCSLPADALLARYSSAGAYTDCYTTAIDRSVSQAEYIQAFYTGGFMKIERLLLSFFYPDRPQMLKQGCLAKENSTTFQLGESKAGQPISCSCVISPVAPDHGLW